MVPVRVAVRTDADDASALAADVPLSVTGPLAFVVVMTPPVARTDASDARMEASLRPESSLERDASRDESDEAAADAADWPE